MSDEYPIPGTTADRILQLLRGHPGLSVNAIKNALNQNPHPVRTYLAVLLKKGLIVDNPNEQGHHAYSAVENAR